MNIRSEETGMADNNKDNIVLIGMPSCGKSTIGVVLAKAMGYRFVDSDLVIQDRTGKLLHEIIEKEGLEAFNRIENDVNMSLDYHRAVIATGGSVVYGKEAMEHLKDIATVIYIKLPYDTLQDRIGDLNERGVSIKEGMTFKELYEERVPLYEKYADIVFEADNLPIREIVRQIKKKFVK
ncbi:MAG: shikimate kinase [Lachnospiraceae bacterium]|nr:shikimate kinase [Lachnoclostridium sp.]MDD7520828.1 shikimate kinase [Lachnoclostridium sp.]MDY2598918.1 shikimate kinase [Lachnospiraceae bacterium]